MRTFQQTIAGDLALVSGRLLLTEDPVSVVAHKLRNRLRFFLGEWFLDTRLGVPYYELVLVKNPDLGVVRRLLSRTISETSELITEIPTLELSLDNTTRTLRVRFEVVCSGDIITGDESGDFFINGVPVYVDPVPVLSSISSVSQLGGTVTATGLNFQPSAVLWTDGVARATTFVNSTTLTATVPAHAVGSVNAYVVQNSGTSGTVNLAYAFTPASLVLTTWLDARDFSPAAFAAQYSWLGRASAGPSGSRRAFRNTAGNGFSGNYPATKNPTAALISGKSVVDFNAVSYTDNDGSNLADNSSPVTWLPLSGIYSQANGAAGSIVVSHTPGFNSPPATGGAPYDNPIILGPVYTGPPDATGPSLIATSDGYGVTWARPSPPYYHTAKVTATHGVLVLLQWYWDAATDSVAIRLGKGPWQTVVSSINPGYADMIRGDMAQIGGFRYPNFYGQPAKPKIAEILTWASVPSQSQFDSVADRAASEWGMSLV